MYKNNQNHKQVVKNIHTSARIEKPQRDGTTDSQFANGVTYKRVPGMTFIMPTLKERL